jgi:hypothetical protein
LTRSVSQPTKPAMTRCPQSRGERGSLKWLQLAVNHYPHLLNSQLSTRVPNAGSIDWLSPLQADDFAEYRDAEFLERIGAGQLTAQLRSFWPKGGPQWDALARSDKGDVFLVEAKAHVGELCSPATGASQGSRQQIADALQQTIEFLGAKPRAAWTDCFYQLANRLAHLVFLRKNNMPAWLVLINFVQDAEMGGPASEAEWRAAYQVVWHVLGVDKKHRLSPFVVEIYPDVSEIGTFLTE